MFFKRKPKENKVANNTKEDTLTDFLLDNNLVSDKGKIKTNFAFRRRKTIKILKQLKEDKVRSLFFYTHVNNIMRQLEFGLQPIKDIRLLPNEEYQVWTYLEKPDHLEFELDNSTRHFFWAWIAENNVNPNEIAIIAIGVDELFKLTTKDWIYDEATRRLHIFEIVNPKAIQWMLIKNSEYLQRIERYIKDMRFNIKVFYGEKGDLANLDSNDSKVNNRKKNK